VTGRRFRHAARVLLGDATPDGRARFDALARWLQDAAYLDVVDAGLGDRGAWVVRRSRLEVARFPAFGEALALETWCSGLGRMWAERRTTVRGDAGASIDAVALWVHVEPESGRPRALDADQLAIWGPSADGRRVRARLRHPNPPPEGAAATPWRFRAADLDVAGHVNNAAYWTVLEEAVTPADGTVAEIEHRDEALAGDAVVRRDGDRWWICARSGEVHASILLDTAAPIGESRRTLVP
jgi:acyl-ACP thioesterase